MWPQHLALASIFDGWFRAPLSSANSVASLTPHTQHAARSGLCLCLVVMIWNTDISANAPNAQHVSSCALLLSVLPLFEMLDSAHTEPYAQRSNDCA